METPKQLHGLCPRCSHFNTCRTPCKPIENFLKRKNKLMEVNGTVYPAGKREVQQGQLIISDTHREMLTEDKLLEFSTINGSAFVTDNPIRNLQTGVFMLKIQGETFQEIADRTDMDSSQIQDLFHAARRRVDTILKALDGGGRLLTPEENQNFIRLQDNERKRQKYNKDSAYRERKLRKKRERYHLKKRQA